MPPYDHPNERGPRPHLIQEIDSESKSIDCAIYQIGDRKVIDSLVRAKKRGVEVRIATDTDWYQHKDPIYQYGNSSFLEAGIKVTHDQKRSLSHNKYCILGRGTHRARVWMGSTNATPQCSQYNGNASFLFYDSDVADIFSKDFEQMAEQKFQKDKGGVFQNGSDVVVVDDHAKTPAGLDPKDFVNLKGAISYPHKVIDGTPVEFYFSPRHNIEKQIVEAIYSAEKSIHFASYALDGRMIYHALMNKAKTPNSGEYNIKPVAVQSEPWEENVKKFRSLGNDGVSVSESDMSDEEWQTWFENNKKLKDEEEDEEKDNKSWQQALQTASYVYTPGEAGGNVKKVQIYGIINGLGAESRGAYKPMIKHGMSVRLAKYRGQLHHKFMIIDKKILILGSYNFSRSAENENDESAIIIRDPEIVGRFYDEVFVPTFKNATPRYLPSKEELEKFAYDRKTVAMTEIQFDSKKGSDGRFVELYNYETCKSARDCERKSVDLIGWKFWNGMVPWHPDQRIRGSSDDLISYYNDPIDNKFGLNDPDQGYLMNRNLEKLYPGEYGLIVGHDFKLEYLDEYLPIYEKRFQEMYGRKPKEVYEKYPKLFVCADPLDSVLGDGLKPYAFLSLFYPDQFTLADRFDMNLSFGVETHLGPEDLIEFILGRTPFKLNLKKGQSLERVRLDHKLLDKDYALYRTSYLNDQFRLTWFGLPAYTTEEDWTPNANLSETPGFSP